MLEIKIEHFANDFKRFQTIFKRFSTIRKFPIVQRGSKWFKEVQNGSNELNELNELK